jgi:glycosyltransferase 2 family protein
MPKIKKSHVQLFIRIVGSSLLILWILHMIDWEKMFEIAKKASVSYLVAAFLAVQLTVLSSVWKWKLLIADENGRENVSLLKLGRFYYVGLFFNNFLPGSVGGDVVRVYYLGRIIGLSKAAASVAFERLTSGIALVAIALFSSFFLKTSKTVTLAVLLVAGIVVVLGILGYLLIKKGPKGKIPTSVAVSNTKFKGLITAKKGLAQMLQTIANYRRKGLIWWGMVSILSILFQVGLAWINQLLFLALGINIPWLDLLMIITIISVITMLPVSVNGLGVREGSYVFFFQQLGVPSEMAVAVSLLFFFLVSVSSLAGGLIWISERGKQGEAVWKQAD